MGKLRNTVLDYEGIKRETDDAIQLLFICPGSDDAEPVWLPKSLIEMDEDLMEVEMPEWLAKEKGLI